MHNESEFAIQRKCDCSKFLQCLNLHILCFAKLQIPLVFWDPALLV